MEIIKVIIAVMLLAGFGIGLAGFGVDLIVSARHRKIARKVKPDPGGEKPKIPAWVRSYTDPETMAKMELDDRGFGWKIDKDGKRTPITLEEFYSGNLKKI